MEGSLKLKEISYIHSEAFQAGELKHGSISLIDKDFGVIAVVTDKEISEKTLGIPIISIGIPTVVELATLVSDGIDIFIDRLQEKAESNEYLNKLQQDDKYEEVKEALNVGEYNMIVTPKEIDDLIENMKDIVARGINFAV
jgi:hypothetical protein